MLLKRHYRRGPDGTLLDPPQIEAVECKNTGWSPAQNFSEGIVEVGVTEGWMVIGKDTITLRVRPEPLVYTIQRMPGRYCLHCGEKLPDDERGVFARAHLAQAHPEQPSPDPAVPAGYVKVNAYECVLDSAQHAKYRARTIGEARREAAQYFREHKGASGG
ncbi:MAG TPA: hypothetical protein VNK91_02005 [Burkholderiaceae bacterium]|nr:hypothetical protein [Burkholderiaceae bacterium]